MTRIDESPEQSFSLIKDILTIQNEVYELLDKNYLLQTSRVADIEKQFRLLQSIIRIAPELYEIVDMAFNQSKKFQTWYMSLDPQHQKGLQLERIENSIKDVFMIHIGQIIGSNTPILLGDNQDGFKAHEYIERTHSRWFIDYKKNENDADRIQIAKYIETFIRNELITIHKIETLNALLAQFLTNNNVSSDDKKNIRELVSLLNKHQENYKQLNLHLILQPHTQTLEEVIARFCDKYQSDAYLKFHKSAENLVSWVHDIAILGDKYKYIASHDEIINAAQVMTHSTLSNLRLLENIQNNIEHEFEEELNKELLDINNVLITANNRRASMDAAYQVDMLLSNTSRSSEQREQAALRGLLAFDTLKLNDLNPNEQIHYRSTYLENLLTEAFPTIFTKNNGLFQCTHPNYAFDAYNAFGIASSGAPFLIKNAALLNPHQFNATQLSKLGERYKATPLWFIMIMIKPIDETFTIKNKIDAYIKVIHLIDDDQIKLNDKSPLHQTQYLANALLELIKSPINDTYTIEERLDAHLQVIQLIKNNQLMLNETHKNNQIEAVAQSALNTAVERGAYSPTITKYFVAIKKEIDPTLLNKIQQKIANALTINKADLNKPSVKKQLKQFLEGELEKNKNHESDTDSTLSGEDSPKNKSL